MVYQWDIYGNLINRNNLNTIKNESFRYDTYNRLINTSVNGNNVCSINFDGKGNITYKSDVGNMMYGSGNPYSLVKISEMPDHTLFSENQNVTYTSFDKVSSITQGTKRLDLYYGADRQRVYHNMSHNSFTRNTTKQFFTNLYEEIRRGDDIKKLHYLTSPSGLFAIFVTHNDTSVMSYVLKDHLGSLYATVTNGDVEYYSFDAWGRERNHNTLQYDNINTTFDRGFCMHEHYRDFGLINMNGRMYDPVVGRMLSPDIVIQNPEYSQSYNRYSYCFNNPLRFTDPSGYVVRGRNDVLNPYFLYYDFSSFSSDGSSFNTDLSAGKQLPVDDWYEDSDGNIQWTDYKSQAEMDVAGIDGKYLGEAVVLVHGSYDEKLGEDGTLTGKGAKPAQITVYGVNNEDDIVVYCGLSVSSDPLKYSMVKSGDYKAFYQDMSTSPYGLKGGSLSYRIMNIDGSLRLPIEGGELNKQTNKNYMEHIFFHRTNLNGVATYSSQGCIIIDGNINTLNNWKHVEAQLEKSSNIFFRITR